MGLDDNIPRDLRRATALIRLSELMPGRTPPNIKDDFEAIYHNEKDKIKTAVRINSEEILEIVWKHITIRMPLREIVDVIMKLHPNSMLNK